MDVDGVLTDGKLHFTTDGKEFKSFHVQDGHGIAMAHRAGLLTGIVTGRPSTATTKRAADLGIRILKQGATNKGELVAEILREHKLRAEEVAFIGDDLVDLPAMRNVGVAIAVANAVAEVKAAADYVTRAPGGEGAVREAIEIVLKARGDWKRLVAPCLALLATGIALGCGKPAPPPTKTSAPTGYIEKFEFPEQDETGAVRRKISGDRAKLLPNGLMDIENARVEFYSSNKVAMVFTSPRCLLDREHNSAKTDAPVRVERDNMIITGIGGDWDSASSSVNIHSNTQMVVRGAGLTK